MSNDSNMAIWSFVDKTDPSGTKTSDQNGRRVTSINGTYMAKKATELFGPIGIGWGYDIEEERYDSAGPIFDKDGGILCNAQNHTIKLRLWYKQGEERGEVVQFGHTKHIYRSKYGFSADDEAPKKSLTDAMKKCLSMLGFSADIFLGQFDDYEYVEAQKAREQLETAESRAEEETKQEISRKEWIADNIRLMGESVTKSMLEGLYKTAMRKAVARGDTEAQKKFDAAKDKKLAQFNEVKK
jgi:hypothetical protein